MNVSDLAPHTPTPAALDRSGKGSLDAEVPKSFERPPTAQEAVLRELRRSIVAGEIKPGERVKQESIAECLGVSRVPIREALKVLETEGQIIHEPHRGYSVTKLSFEELQEIYLMRRLLEDEVVRRAIQNIDEGLLRRLEQLMAGMDEAMETFNLHDFAVLNKEFHFALFARAKLPRFYRSIEILWQNSDAYRSVYLNDPATLLRVRTEHEAILKACRDRDADALVQATNQQRVGSMSRLANVLKPALDETDAAK